MIDDLQHHASNELPEIDASQKQLVDKSEGMVFEIHVKGHLDDKWLDWLEGLEARLLENGEMILIGPIVDQAALMGVLNKLSRLNLTLLSVNTVDQNTKKEKK